MLPIKILIIVSNETNDKFGLKYVELLNEYLTKEKVDVTIFKFNIEIIEKFIFDNKEKYRIVFLAVHSSYFKDQMKDLDMYILDNNNQEISFISHHLSYYLNLKNIKNKIYQGSKNKINLYGIENILIEINEDKNKVIKEIANWIIDFFINPKIVSPISGVIDSLENKKIGIYIRGPYDNVQDDHKIFAPATGKLLYIPKDGFIDNMNFKSSFKKRGTLSIVSGNIKFDVIVGEGFVTDNITIKKKDKANIGEEIAKIIIKPDNSYAFINIIPYPYLKKNMEIIGGKSCLYMPNKNNNSVEIVNNIDESKFLFIIYYVNFLMEEQEKQERKKIIITPKFEEIKKQIEQEEEEEEGKIEDDSDERYIKHHLREEKEELKYFDIKHKPTIKSYLKENIKDELKGNYELMKKQMEIYKK